MHDNKYPYITTVYKFSDLDFSYTMEYCPYNLDTFIAKHNTKLSFAKRKSLALQLLKGLDFLHNRSILHRDLSYGNILVIPYGDLFIIKISDFGLAKDKQDPITSMDSSLKGTFLDPCLESLGAFDVQNEVYSIGFILWYIFTGRKNIIANDSAISKLVSKCMDTDKEKRFKDIQELMSTLSSIQSLADLPKNQMTISEIKKQIIDKLYPSSANDLPSICASIGLRDGDTSESFHSKRNYVSTRLHDFDIEDCLKIIDKLKKQHGIEITVQ